MLLGIPRGYFYYNYLPFIKTLFDGTGVAVMAGPENNDDILARGKGMTADEACLPVKMFAGQIDALGKECDRVMVPRIMKDMKGRWLCPEQLGLPELCIGKEQRAKTIVTDPLFFNDFAGTRRAFWKVFKELGVKPRFYRRNFRNAYAGAADVASGRRNMHMEADWEFTYAQPGPGEIVLPGTRRVLVTGHCYNVYDRFINGDILRMLDDIGIDALTEKDADRGAADEIFCSTPFLKKPFWEAFARIYGTAMSMSDTVDGIIYLSSFSCGVDAFVSDMLRLHLGDIPFMVLKLDEHKGNVGLETRIEAFADMLERRGR